MATYSHRHREVYNGVRIDVKATSSKELHAKVKKKKDEIDRGIIDSSIRFKDYGIRYLEAHKLHTVSSSWYKDIKMILAMMVRSIGNKPIGNIKPTDLQLYLNGLTGYSDSYIKKQYDLLRQIFHQAYIDKAAAEDLSISLTRPKGIQPDHGRSLTDRERQVLLLVLAGHRGELFCKIMLYCGLRPSEVQALQWKDIDTKRKTIEVSKSMKKDGSVGQPKTTAAYRTVPIPDHFVPLLNERMGKPFDYIFSLSLEWRKKMWRNIRREMNLAMGCRTYRNKLVPPYPLADDFHLYNLRHTYCTDLEKAGVPINIASRLMGHSSIEITSKIYTHASVEALEMARELINA